MPAHFPPSSPIVLAVGTTNKAKLESVHAAVHKCFPENSVVLFSFAVESGVSDQPMTAEETQTGAINRAVAALEAARKTIDSTGGLRLADARNRALHLPIGEETSFTEVHFGIGLEGGVERVGAKYFECGWMAVAENPENAYLRPEGNARDASREVGTAHGYNIGVGSSARFEMSEVLMHKIVHEGKELATVMDELTGETDLRSTLGAMGVLTAGKLGRAAAYEHGMLFALAPFLSSEKFWHFTGDGEK